MSNMQACFSISFSNGGYRKNHCCMSTKCMCEALDIKKENALSLNTKYSPSSNYNYKCHYTHIVSLLILIRIQEIKTTRWHIQSKGSQRKTMKALLEMCSSSGSMTGRQNFEIFPSKNKKILSLSQNPLILFYEEIKHLKIESEDLKTTGVPWPALQYRSCLLQNLDSRCWVRIWRYLKIYGWETKTFLCFEGS